MRGTRNISSITTIDAASEYIGAYNPYKPDEDELVLLDMGNVSKRSISGIHVIDTIEVSDGSALEHLKSERTIRTGTTDTTLPPSFISSKRHTDVSPEELSERWGIGIEKARKRYRKLRNDSYEVLFCLYHEDTRQINGS